MVSHCHTHLQAPTSTTLKVARLARNPLQARALRMPKVVRPTQDHCRSALARESILPVTNQAPDTHIRGQARSYIDVQRMISHRYICGPDLTHAKGCLPYASCNAGAALPTPQVARLAQNHCRSALARESILPVTNQSPDTLHSRASALLLFGVSRSTGRTNLYLRSRLNASSRGRVSCPWWPPSGPGR